MVDFCNYLNQTMRILIVLKVIYFQFCIFIQNTHEEQQLNFNFDFNWVRKVLNRYQNLIFIIALFRIK
jgi:hypothetical protein